MLEEHIEIEIKKFKVYHNSLVKEVYSKGKTAIYDTIEWNADEIKFKREKIKEDDVKKIYEISVSFDHLRNNLNLLANDYFNPKKKYRLTIDSNNLERLLEIINKSKPSK